MLQITGCQVHVVEKAIRPLFADRVTFSAFTPYQSGFCCHYYTQDELLFVTNKWLRAIDQGKYTGAVLLDLAKAFDTVDHTLLCSRLKYNGFQGISYDLSHNYPFQVGNNMFCSMVIYWIGILLQLVYLRDPFWALYSLRSILMICLRLLVILS